MPVYLPHIYMYDILTFVQHFIPPLFLILCTLYLKGKRLPLGNTVSVKCIQKDPSSTYYRLKQKQQPKN